MNEENTITDIAHYKSGLDDERHNLLANAFNEITVGLEDALEEAKGIEISGVTDLVNMRKARESRLALRTIRIATEHKRVKMKEASLLEGKAIDGMANIVKALVVPIEKDLQEKEEFIQREEDKRIVLLVEERKAKLEKFDVDCEHFNLGEMKDEAFDSLLSSSDAGYHAKIAAERAEAERIENEEITRRANEMKLLQEKEAAEAEAEVLRKAKEDADMLVIQERLDREKAEQAAYAKVAEEKRQAQEIVDIQQQEALNRLHEAEESARLQREKADAELAEEKAKQQAEIKRMEDEKREVEAEADRLKAVEAKRIADEAKAKADEEQRRLEGGDKRKLEIMIDDINTIATPDVLSDASKEAVTDAKVFLKNAVGIITDAIEEME